MSETTQATEIEIMQLEILADMAEDLEQKGRAIYCRRRARQLRARMAAQAVSDV